MFKLEGSDGNIHWLDKNKGNEFLSLCGIETVNYVSYGTPSDCEECLKKKKEDKVVPTNEIINFINKLKDNIYPMFMEHYSSVGKVCEKIKIETDIMEYDHFTSYSLCMTIRSREEDNFDQDVFDQEFSFYFSVTNVDNSSIVFIDLIQLPKHLRGKGIFSGLVKEIKEFMVNWDLGILVGMTDSSDNGESSYVLEKYGLHWDPFLPTRLDWDK